MSVHADVPARARVCRCVNMCVRGYACGSVKVSLDPQGWVGWECTGCLSVRAPDRNARESARGPGLRVQVCRAPGRIQRLAPNHSPRPRALACRPSPGLRGPAAPAPVLLRPVPLVAASGQWASPWRKFG